MELALLEGFIFLTQCGLAHFQPLPPDHHRTEKIHEDRCI